MIAKVFAFALAVAPAAAAAADAPRLALLPIRLLDTSGEPADQNADHGKRLVAMQGALARDLAPVYRVSSFSEAELDAACPGSDGDCVAAFARDRGLDAALVAVVHKSSSLILQLFVRIVDVSADRIVVARELNFRGDTDESWRRAEGFLAGQLLDASKR